MAFRFVLFELLAVELERKGENVVKIGTKISVTPSPPTMATTTSTAMMMMMMVKDGPKSCQPKA